jgi:SAM-dependent methyltransferase
VTAVFGSDYADSYDALYADKDYAAECDLLEAVFRRRGDAGVRRVLDLGCGTGRHSVELARRGYEVTGVDLSAGMLEKARRRAAAEPGPARVDFVLGNIADVRVERQFDAVICMFAVLGYQIEDEALRATLANVRRHLAPGGLFVFDVWHGPAVEAIGPTLRTKVVEAGAERIERRALGTLEAGRRVCTVRYDVIRRRPGVADSTFVETHRMRYFDEPELRAALGDAGLSLESLTAFPDVENPPTTETWNVLAVAAG